MCVAATAKRRRRQATNGFRHIARLSGRRIYKKRSVESQTSRLARAIATERRIAQKTKR